MGERVDGLRGARGAAAEWSGAPPGQRRAAGADGPTRAATAATTAAEAAAAAAEAAATTTVTEAAAEAAAEAATAEAGRGADAAGGEPAVRDLRGTAARRTLRYPAGDVLVVSGLPGSGKSTLIRRVVAVQDAVFRVDSQDTRERWARRLPRRLPYAAYRPLVRLAHYVRLRRALASGASVVVHDCGTQRWVRDWLARDARRRNRALHLVLLDVPPAAALAGQAERGRAVSAYAFLRHRRTVRQLLAAAEAGRAPRGCDSVLLLDRGAAGALRGLAFE